MPSELDADTALVREGDGVYRGAVTGRWGVVSGVPNGGYLMCYALRALLDASPHPDPLTMTAHFLRPGAVGPVTVEVEIVKEGKRNATAMARVLQEHGEILRAIATFGRGAGEGGATIMAGEPPRLPPLEACIASAAGPLPDIARRFDNRVDPSTFGWASGKPSGEMVIRAWMRLADGRPPDALALPLFADGLPPPVFSAVPPAWVPTVELTIHFRARPAPGWLRAEFRTRFVAGGLLDEDGELWDETGTLVALTRQLALLPNG